MASPRYNFVNSVILKDAEKVRSCLEQDPSLANICTSCPILHSAVHYSTPEIVDILLKAGADVNATDSYNHTAFHRAIAHARGIEIARILLHAGASVKIGDNGGMPLLSWALTWDKNNLELSRLLLDAGVDIDEVGYDNNTALYSAVLGADVEKIKFLLDNNARVDISHDVNGTPLCQAAFYGHVEVLKLLIDAGADINASTNDKSTPLHIAVKQIGSGKKFVDTVRGLLIAGANTDLCDDSGMTALYYAASNEDISSSNKMTMVRLLLANGLPEWVISSQHIHSKVAQFILYVHFQLVNEKRYGNEIVKSLRFNPSSRFFEVPRDILVSHLLPNILDASFVHDKPSI